MKKIIKSKIIILVSMITCFIIIIGLTVTVVSSQAKTNDLNETLSIGEKYLQELDYTQSIMAFKEAIRIDPKNVEAYKGLAEAYIGLKQYQDATDTLTVGIEKTSDSSLKKLLETVQELVNAKETQQEENADVNETISPYSITRPNPTDRIEYTPIVSPTDVPLQKTTSESAETPKVVIKDKPIVSAIPTEKSTPEPIPEPTSAPAIEATPESTQQPTPEQVKGWRELYTEVLLNIDQYMEGKSASYATTREYNVKIMNLDFRGDPELLISNVYGEKQFEENQTIFYIDNNQVRKVKVDASSMASTMGYFKTYRNKNTNQIEWLYNLYSYDGHIYDFEDTLSEMSTIDIEQLQYSGNNAKTITVQKYNGDDFMGFETAKEEYNKMSSGYEPINTPVYTRAFNVSFDDESDLTNITLQFTKNDITNFLNQY